jgi:hypothetical protein
MNYPYSFLMLLLNSQYLSSLKYSWWALPTLYDNCSLVGSAHPTRYLLLAPFLRVFGGFRSRNEA